MDNNMMNNNLYYGQQVMGQQPYYGGYDPNAYAYNAYGYNANAPMPSNQNALTAEEMQALENAKPSSKINLTIDHLDVLRSICGHKKNGRDVVQMVNDGTGDVWCPICNKRWKPDMKTKEEVQELVAELLEQMQNAKWTGDLPTDLTRELFTMMPLLEKYPEIHEYAANTFNKYYAARNTYSAQDTGIYNMYNSMFGGNTGYGYAVPMQSYYPQQQQAPQGYYNQQPQGYYPQQPVNGYVPNGVQQANAMVNPMQAPTYGVNPYAPNQQFVQQANTMMGGTVQQPMYTAPGAPVFGTPQTQVPQQNTQQPAQQAQTQQNAGPVITAQPDGTVTSENKITL